MHESIQLVGGDKPRRSRATGLAPVVVGLIEHFLEVNLARNMYEGMFLLDSGKTSGNWDAATKLVHGILERHRAEVVASRPWDERRLTYSVKGHKKGMYLLTYFRADGPSLSEIEHDCRINEAILRQLVLKVHPKLADQLVAQAMAPREPPPAEEPRAEAEVEERVPDAVEDV